MKKLKIVAFMGLIALLIFAGVRLLNSPTKTKPVSVSYSDFISLIESEKVASVELQE